MRGGFGSIDIVAADEDVIVIVDAKAHNGTDSFSEEDNDRAKRKILVTKWLAENAERGGASILFDAISMMVAIVDSALLRHRIHKLSAMKTDERPLTDLRPLDPCLSRESRM